eukprot:COSAG03_NODE_13772_length_489_cov_0.479487_1_plen_130_part_10
MQLVRGARDAAAAVSTMAEDLSEMSERVDFSSRVVVSAVEGARDTALLSIEGLRSETEGVSSQLQGLQESSALALQRHVSLAEKQAALRDDLRNAAASRAAARGGGGGGGGGKDRQTHRQTDQPINRQRD